MKKADIVEAEPGVYSVLTGGKSFEARVEERRWFSAVKGFRSRSKIGGDGSDRTVDRVRTGARCSRLLCRGKSYAYSFLSETR